VRIILGSDHNGFGLKEELKRYLAERGHQPDDVGTSDGDTPVDYPDIAVELSARIASGDYARGLLVCGTGLGMAIAANKVDGVRAACCHDPYSAERARKSNDAQVLTLGSQIVGVALARVIIDHWLSSEFEGGRSGPKVEKLKQLDRRRTSGATALPEDA